jgi:AcrR family transcriptional regulator
MNIHLSTARNTRMADAPQIAQTAKRAPTRERILGAAERLFAEQGFDRVTMPAIAEASGITAGAIYKHFASKGDLFFEVVKLAVQASPPVDETSGPRGALAAPALVASYAARRMKRMRQIALEVHSASTKDAKVGQLLRRTLEAQIGETRDRIARGQAAGEIDPAPDPGHLATLMFVMIMGLSHMDTLSPGLIGDAAWSEFIESRAALMLGLDYSA